MASDDFSGHKSSLPADHACSSLGSAAVTIGQHCKQADDFKETDAIGLADNYQANPEGEPRVVKLTQHHSLGGGAAL